MRIFRSVIMPERKTKTVVLEIERVQVIRKKCKAYSGFCANCRTEANFVELAQTARLFEIHITDLFRFIQTSGGHYTNNPGEEIFLCVNSFLECLRNHKNNSKIKMINGAINK